MIESITGCVASDDRTDHRMRVDGLQLNDHRNESGAGRRLIVWALQISMSRLGRMAKGEFTAQGLCVVTDTLTLHIWRSSVQSPVAEAAHTGGMFCIGVVASAFMAALTAFSN